MDIQEQAGKGNDCFVNLTLDQQYSSIALSGVCIISLLVSIPAVCLAVHEYCIINRLTNWRTERLLLYLVCGLCLGSFVGCFQWIGPLTLQSHSARIACSAVGYLWLMVSTFCFIITFFIGIHFFVQIFKPKILSTTPDRIKIVARRMEIAYLTLSVLAAFLLTPWLFLNHAFGYNLWVCWIDTTDRDCTTVKVSITEVTVYYVSVLAIALFSFTILIFVHISICLRKRNIHNLYVWAFTIYLVSIMLNFIITTVVDFLGPDKVPSVIHFIKIPAIGIIPLTGSTVTLVAVVYKKCFHKRFQRSQPLNYNGYNSIDEEDDMSENMIPSRVTTSKWNPPRSSDIASTARKGS